MSEARNNSGRVVAWASALGVLLLAAAAVWWPRPVHLTAAPVVVVLDPAGEERRLGEVWPALGAVLAAARPEAPRLVVARTLPEFRQLATGRPDYLVCPDGVALGLDPAAWVPVAAGRRPAPRNLRPHGVLLSRVAAAGDPTPWLTRPGAVIFGDSLSLTATGVLRPAAASTAGLPGIVSWGPDPYDHGPVLHALRLGAFAFAVVRQWDAERFLAQGLLDPAAWTVRELTVPVPDLVVLADRRVPAAERLALGERLSGIGRELADLTPAERRLAAALPCLGLAGFNLLIEPDFELVRGNFAADWPRPRP